QEGDHDVVRHHAREPDLPARVVKAEGERVLDRANHALARATRGPVRAAVEEVVDQVQVQPAPVGADRILAAGPFGDHEQQQTADGPEVKERLDVRGGEGG